MNTQAKNEEMKKITFTECQAVWISYDVELEISNEDYELLQNDELDLLDIIDEYDVDYGEPTFNDMVHGTETEFEDLEFLDDESEVA